VSADSGKPLPAIPAKRYFTIGEVSELCGVKAYVLRYWEQEFTQLKPMKRRGNRRYYQHHEVLLIRRIRDLLYEQGFTISGARNQLTDAMAAPAAPDAADAVPDEELGATPASASRRDPAARTRASDRAAEPAEDAIAVLASGDDDAALEAELDARARDDEATIERARRALGEIDPTPAAVVAPAHAASRAGARSVALTARAASAGASASPRAASPSTHADAWDAAQLRAELLAIRALLIS
jgi:DNA-binding transcriptional MerR regulator